MKTIEFVSFLDDYALNRIRSRLRTECGELKDVMFQYETMLDSEWVAIVRYDCAHGFFHRDVMSPNGDEEKVVITVDSIQHAAQYAENDLKSKWEWYKEKYIKKIKLNRR